MKKNFSLLSFALVAFVLVFSSCKRDDDISPEQEALNNLGGTWTINSATTPDGNVPLTGVSINFDSENLTYVVSGLNTLNDNDLNYAGVFVQGGSFALNSNQTAVILTPGGTVNYVISENNITLSYQSEFPKASDPLRDITLTGTK